MISARERGCLLWSALQLLEAMLHQTLHPDAITYNDVISACEKGPLSQRALELFQTMLHQGLLLNVITYNAAESLAARGGSAAPRPPPKRDHF